MFIDIRTLILLISISDALLIGIFLFQYFLNKTFSGIGWWTLGMTALSIGFFLFLQRDFITIKLISIVIANSIIISGIIFFYIGIMRFLEKKESLMLISSVLIMSISSLLFFTYIRDNISVRTFFIFAVIAIMSIISAKNLFIQKLRSIAVTARFNSMVFLSFGVLFGLGAITALVTPLESIFSPTPIQISSFLATPVYHILMTFGLILMVNQRLNAEIQEARNEQQLIFSSSPGAALITRLSDGAFADINEKFAELTGYSREEIIGKFSGDIQLWKYPQEQQKFIDEIKKNGYCRNMEVNLVRKDRNSLTAIMSAKIITLRGVPHVMSVSSDITDRKQAEEKIGFLLAEKELLLKEVHHRVKNNMSTINSLLYLQSNTLKDPAAVTALQDAASRVQSMAVLYDKLYRTSEFKFMSINDYLSPLIDGIVSYFPKNIPLQIDKEIDAFLLPAETLFPIGIITNELITNMMKHAFNGRENGVIKTSAVMKDHYVTIGFGDDGIGISEDIELEHSSGFGLKLVALLTKQLGGSVRLERGNGTRFFLEFETPGESL